MSKTHYLDKECLIELNDKIIYYTACGLKLMITHQKVKDNDVLLGYDVLPNTQDKSNVTCNNCKKTYE